MFIKSFLCGVCAVSLGFIGTSQAATVFSDNFIGYTGLNTPPTGWTNFASGGVDSSQSAFWLGTPGTQTPYSPDGDIYYVRGLSSANQLTQEGMAIQLSGLTIGTTYDISFFNAASTNFGGGNAWWDLFVDGSSIGSSKVGLVGASLVWESSLLSFVATNSIHTLGFQARSASGTLGNALIDGVVVSAIPIPAAFWLFGSGFIGLIGIARRKKP